MGDISAEPSMEEILSSIKRIIAEEGDGSQPRTRRPQRVAMPMAYEDDAASANDGDDGLSYAHPARDRDEEPRRASQEPILELSDPMPEPEQPRRARGRGDTSSSAAIDSILSQETAAASRGSLETLSKLLVRPEPGSEGTLEGLVREMLRPMLRDWLDANPARACRNPGRAGD